MLVAFDVPTFITYLHLTGVDGLHVHLRLVETSDQGRNQNRASLVISGDTLRVDSRGLSVKILPLGARPALPHDQVMTIMLVHCLLADLVAESRSSERPRTPSESGTRAGEKTGSSAFFFVQGLLPS